MRTDARAGRGFFVERFACADDVNAKASMTAQMMREAKRLVANEFGLGLEFKFSVAEQSEQRDDPLIARLGGGGIAFLHAFELVLEGDVKRLCCGPCADDFFLQLWLRIEAE